MKALLRCLPVAAIVAVAMMAVTQPTTTGPLPLRTRPVQTELAKLQGNWVYTSIMGDQFPEVEYDDGEGTELGAEGQDFAQFPSIPLHFQGNQMFFGNASCTFTLEPTAVPKQIDFVIADDPEKRIWKGIYETDGNNLSICLGLSPDVPRPTDFTSKAGSYCSLQTHARVAGIQASVPSAALRRKKSERVTSLQVVPLIGEKCQVALRSHNSDPFWQPRGGRLTGEILKVEKDRLLLNTLEREGVTYAGPEVPDRYAWVNAGIGRERSTVVEETWISLNDIDSITPLRRADGVVGQADPRSSDFYWRGGGGIGGSIGAPGVAR